MTVLSRCPHSESNGDLGLRSPSFYPLNYGGKRPYEESNLDLGLRRATLYPLSYRDILWRGVRCRPILKELGEPRSSSMSGNYEDKELSLRAL